MENSQEAYANLREKVAPKVEAAMAAKRFRHSLGVERAARLLAARFGGNVEQAGLAGLVHDYAKERSDDEFLAAIKEKQLDPKLANWNNSIWHGVVGRYFVADELEVRVPEILLAIERHTVGAAEMSLLDKILYVADYIEDNRQFPGVDEARAIAKVDLDLAVAFETSQTLSHLIAQRQSIYPMTLTTYNAYVAHFKEEV